MRNYKMSLSLAVTLLMSGILQAQENTEKIITIQNERTVNTALLDFSPAFYEDGIVYISSQLVIGKEKIYDKAIGRKTMSIFRARRGSNGILSKPEPFAQELVSLLHEGPVTFDKTGENVFFTRNNNDGKKANYVKGISRLKIYASRKEAGVWLPAIELPFNENVSDAAHPSVSVDGDRLYFASNRAGGYGGMDVYVCERMGDTWGKPVNLGPKINTNKNEVFPFVHPDGTLFFSSDGLYGRGGLDIFYSKPSVLGGFDTPKALGNQFNTDHDDFGIIIDVDMKNGYFTSSRSGGLGEDDIYSFNIQKGQLLETAESEDLTECNRTNSRYRLLDVVAIDRETGQTIESASVNFVNMDELSLSEIISNKQYANTPLLKPDGTISFQSLEQKSQSKLTDGTGRTQLKLVRSGNYVLNVAKRGYIGYQMVIKNSDLRNTLIALLDKAPACINLTGKTLKADDSTVIPKASIYLVDSKGIMLTLESDNEGKFSTCLKCNEKYKITANYKGFSSEGQELTTLNLSCTEWLEYPKNLELNLNVPRDYSVVPTPNIAEGIVFRLKNIYYNFNDASIRPDAHEDLNAVVAMMKKYPDMEIELSSHTDSRGSVNFNKDLSQRRADNAAQYLFLRGIDAMRVKPVGHGESKLLNYCSDDVNCSEQEHANNRRTEVRIIKGGSATGKVTTDAKE
jgi:outer membrane protein OmpA-like peptidoglycan-associated protein/Tol biopolymer transport system component